MRRAKRPAKKEESDEEEVAVVEQKEEATPKRGGKRQAVEKTAANKQEQSLWKQVDTLLVFANPDSKPSEKVAGFDMDGTLVFPKSGAKFPKNRSDWSWWHEKVVPRLQQLHKDGLKVVIITNQAGISKGHQAQNDITGKILDLQAALGFPIQALVATADDVYRKPSDALWKYFVANMNGGVKPDLSKSMHIGDAAGRDKGWKAGMKADFSCGDRKFAHNIGVKFETPEEFFLGEAPVAFDWDGVDPKAIQSAAALTDDRKPLHSTSQEVIVLVGFPAAGKSTFTRKHLVPHGYVHVNQDTLKTKEKCFKLCRESVQAGKSVVIDNTNGDASVRAEYIQIAKDKGIPCRCFHIQTPEEVTNHLNYFRERYSKGEAAHVPRIGYAVFKKKFTPPTVAEGFSEVKRINFVVEFDNDEHKELFYQWA